MIYSFFQESPEKPEPKTEVAKITCRYCAKKEASVRYDKRFRLYIDCEYCDMRVFSPSRVSLLSYLLWYRDSYIYGNDKMENLHPYLKEELDDFERRQRFRPMDRG